MKEYSIQDLLIENNYKELTATVAAYDNKEFNLISEEVVKANIMTVNALVRNKRLHEGKLNIKALKTLYSDLNEMLVLIKTEPDEEEPTVIRYPLLRNTISEAGITMLVNGVNEGIFSSASGKFVVIAETSTWLPDLFRTLKESFMSFKGKRKKLDVNEKLILEAFLLKVSPSINVDIRNLQESTLALLNSLNAKEEPKNLKVNESTFFKIEGSLDLLA